MSQYFFRRHIIKSVGISTIIADLVDVDIGLYQLRDPFIYIIRSGGHTYRFTIPAGFYTNFASVPRCFWEFFHPVENEMLVASCVHDFILNEFKKLQPGLSRTILKDGSPIEIHDCIDGFLAADLFVDILKQEQSYNALTREFLRACVKGYYLATTKGWYKVD